MHKVPGLRVRLGRLRVLGVLAGAWLIGVATASSQEGAVSLSSLYGIGPGGALRDTNGDGFADRLGARIVLPDAPSAAEVAAGAEIAARLGFETLALDLPLGDMSGIAIAIGREAATALGAAPGPNPEAGSGATEVLAGAEGPVVAVLGGDEDGLAAAAVWLAGRAPAVFAAGGASLEEVEDAVAEAAGDAGNGVRTVRVEVAAGSSALLSAEVRLEAQDAAAAQGIREAVEGAAEELRFDDLAALVVTAVHGGGEEQTTLRHDPPAPEPGPVSGRPGSGGKDELGLGVLYEPAGLLGDSNGDRIPDRLDSRLVVTSEAPAHALALAARLGLESAGLDFPVTATPDSIGEPERAPTLILTGTVEENPLLRDLRDREALPALEPGEGHVGVVPDAFGDKPALVVTGGDLAGLVRAFDQAALSLPHLDAASRKKDHPAVPAVEDAVRRFLAIHTPAGQAAAAVYRLERIAADISHLGIESSRILVSVKDPAPGLGPFLADRAAELGLGEVEVELDDRNVERAAVLREEEFDVPSEVEAFREIVRARLLPGVGRGDRVQIEALLSEPAEIRRALEDEVRAQLRAAGARDPEVRILSAYRQGYGWIEEVVLPELLELRESGSAPERVRLLFRRHRPPPEWPQQAMHTPLRFQHAMFPADEILAEALSLDLESIGYEMREEEDAPAYQVVAEGAGGEVLVNRVFEPRMVTRPFLDRYPDYELIQVPTGGIRADVDGETVLDERIATDAESFWDHFQADTLARIYDYLMELHEGKPRGPADAPYFGELHVVLSLSEPERRLGIEQEIESTHDALHEDIYFVTHTFLRLIGRNAMGTELTFPGRVIPEMRGKTDGTPGTARIRFTGFRTSRPAVEVDYTAADGHSGSARRNLSRVQVEEPRALALAVRSGEPGIEHLRLRVKVDTDADEHAEYVERHGVDQTDARILSAQQATRTLEILAELRAAGLYRDALAFAGLGRLELAAGWTWEEDPEAQRTVVLAPNGEAPPFPDVSAFRGDTGNDDQLVQWDSPIRPGEAYGILARMAEFPEATVYRVGESYLGQSIWAMDLMPPVEASHLSARKASLLKPTIVYTARQHANEVSSTSHVLRLAEQLLTDPEERAALDRVNVVIHPIQNPDGAQLAWEMHQYNPEHILHAGYWGSLGIDSTTGAGEDMPIYPEAEVRPRLWRMWLPDIVLNPHGYPAHQLVQLFSEFSGLVRAGRRTERNWGLNKGWFMPGFEVVDDPELPQHKEEALKIRKYITDAIQATGPVAAMNERNYARYDRYGRQFDPESFRWDIHDGVNIQMPIKGRRASGGGRGGFSYDPKITIWSGGTEAPDEPARGDWMKLVASAGLAWDRAILQYLLDGNHEVERNHSDFFGGVSLRMHRPRPPEPPEDAEETEDPEGSAR